MSIRYSPLAMRVQMAARPMARSLACVSPQALRGSPFLRKANALPLLRTGTAVFFAPIFFSLTCRRWLIVGGIGNATALRNKCTIAFQCTLRIGQRYRERVGSVGLRVSRID